MSGRRAISAACVALAAACAAAGRCRASHEDAGSWAHSAAMGDAVTAVDDGAASLDYNPAGLAAARTLQLHSGFRRAFLIPGARTDLTRTALAGAVPVDLPGAKGVLGLTWSQNRRKGGVTRTVFIPSDLAIPFDRPLTLDVDDEALESSLGVAWARRGWRELGSGVLDAGVAFKALRRASLPWGGSVTKAGVDAGVLYRLPRGRAAGLSALNINGPRTDSGGVPDRAPLIVKAGYAHAFRGFVMSADLTKREASSSLPSTEAAGLGVQHWWHTARRGAFAGRSGLNVSGRGSWWAVGAGWRVMGAELDYTVTVPLESGSRWGNAVSLAMRFGTWNPEAEYERMLSSELKYRQELSRALEAAEVMQWRLQDELRQLKADLDDLKARLTESTAEGEAARARVRSLEDRQRAAAEALREAERRRAEVRQKTVEMRYREDWAAYLRLKSEGAPDVVLVERVKQVLREYKEASVDLSEPTQELQRLLRSR